MWWLMRGLADDACPGIPLQACDIVREDSSGRLFILEINAGGKTWDFSFRRVEGTSRMTNHHADMFCTAQQIMVPAAFAVDAIIRSMQGPAQDLAPVIVVDETAASAAEQG
jgi:hypothetical protein